MIWEVVAGIAGLAIALLQGLNYISLLQIHKAIADLKADMFKDFVTKLDARVALSEVKEEGRLGRQQIWDHLSRMEKNT